MDNPPPIRTPLSSMQEAIPLRYRVLGLAVAIVIVVSWVNNLYVHAKSLLPHARFLSHRIEVTDAPGDSFFLYYIANIEDRRVPVSVAEASLPNLRFEPVYEYMTFRHQALYRMMGHFESLAAEPASREADPRTIRAMDVYFNDGTHARMEIGEMIVYRDKPQSEGDPLKYAGGSSSNDGSGNAVFTTDKFVTLTGLSSAYLGELGSSFQYELRGGTGQSSPSGEEAARRSLSVSYRFTIPPGSPLRLTPISMRTLLRYKDADGRDWAQPVRIEQAPYPTEAEMRRYVSEQRRDKS
ncbi:hypothetical protein [Cohnella sp. JJ-181]|uniref:hypothetical protein n=1 Tax=Cohnella rhizoplanae TaxID=2974897 RepID=UPI0022FFC08B|nr:hypothetical protein [Cohnella sp. JJ-181]CAI6085920.1 hypothetical protein COHCIP112018_04838 [Cohnella sp. JJ-181]